VNLNQAKAQAAQLDFEFLADSILQLVWVTTPEGEPVYYNQRWVEYTGLSVEQLRRVAWSHVVHPDDYDQTLQAWYESIRTGETFQQEYRFRKADGSYRWFLVRGTPRRDDKGEIVKWFGTCTDIDEGKRQAQQLQTKARKLAKVNQSLASSNISLQITSEVSQKQKQWLYSLFLQAPVAIGMYNGPEHIVEIVNPEMANIWARPMDRCIGKPLFDVLPEVRGQGFEAILSDVLTSGKPFEAYEVPASLLRDGGLHTGFYHILYQPIVDIEQQVTGILQISVDVTAQVEARKATEGHKRELEQHAQELEAVNRKLRSTNGALVGSNEALTFLNEQLGRVNADLDSFVYAASHDLKSPVATLRGLLSLLTKRMSGKLDRQGEEIVSMLELSLSRLERTIEDLSGIVKVGREMDQDKESLSIEEVFSDVMADLGEMVQQTGARLYTSFGVTHLAYARKHLRSVLYNLLSNALKYHSPQRAVVIRVSTHKENGQIILTVEDNGLGLSDKQLEKLFTMFGRFHDHVEGSGVGLYLLKRIIENNKGQVQVSSKQGEGTIFRITMGTESTG
jgi:PAS domain S-box-containing protein